MKLHIGRRILITNNKLNNSSCTCDKSILFFYSSETRRKIKEMDMRSFATMKKIK